MDPRSPVTGVAIPEFAESVKEEAIIDHVFDLIFAIDELVTYGGHVEPISIQQVRVNLVCPSGRFVRLLGHGISWGEAGYDGEWKQDARCSGAHEAEGTPPSSSKQRLLGQRNHPSRCCGRHCHLRLFCCSYDAWARSGAFSWAHSSHQTFVSPSSSVLSSSRATKSPAFASGLKLGSKNTNSLMNVFYFCLVWERSRTLFMRITFIFLLPPSRLRKRPKNPSKWFHKNVFSLHFHS